MDSAPSPASITQAPESERPQSAANTPAWNGQLSQPLEARIPALRELCILAECDTVGLLPAEFGDVLLTVADRCNANQPAGTVPTTAQRDAFFRGLHLAELALAHACARGRDAAWRVFLTRYREPLAQAATAITGSATLGRELADALPSELFGLSAREGERRSPLASYSGRGSLLGWLRSTLAQRHIDRHRRTHRETPLDTLDLPAAPPAATTSSETVVRLQTALAAILHSLDPEDAFVLSAWFLEGRTLLQIARLLRVSEATVSRQTRRLTAHLRTQLVDRLQATGMSRRAAEEALGTDPRDLTLNLRGLLQTRASAAFPEQTQPPQTATE